MPNLHLGRLDAEWICAKKDWQEVKRRAKEQTGPVSSRRKSLVEVLRFRGTSLGDITSSSLQESEGDEAYELVSAPSDNEPSRGSGAYQPEMDDMRCVLYSHGGMNLSISLYRHSQNQSKAATILAVWTRKGSSSE